MAIIMGVIGVIIGLVLIGYGIKGGTIIVSRGDTGESAPVSGQPNWLMIIIGVILAISSIVGVIKASG